jgi:ribosomal protein S18 acetylase RimI-like enzyme
LEHLGGGFSIYRISPDEILSGFDCGDEDLNEFLLKDAPDYERSGLAVTKIIRNQWGKIVAFWSLANDAISTATTELSNRQFHRFRERFEEPKQVLKSFPAVKLARLGVDIEFQRSSFGEFILQKIELQALESFSAVAFITVDAYQNPKAVAFYKKHGFEYLTEKDEGRPVRFMVKQLLR